MELSKGAITRIFLTQDTSEKPKLEITELRYISTDPLRFRVALSDGVKYQDGLLAGPLNDLVAENKLKLPCIVRLNKYICHEVQNMRILIIRNMEVLLTTSNWIGHPSHVDGPQSSPYIDRVLRSLRGALELSQNSISYICETGDTASKQPVLQVLDLWKLPSTNSRTGLCVVYCALLSDGEKCHRAMFSWQHSHYVSEHVIYVNCIIRLTQYSYLPVATSDRKEFSIQKFDFVSSVPNRIGNPRAVNCLGASVDGRVGITLTNAPEISRGAIFYIFQANDCATKPLLQAIEIVKASKESETILRFHILLSDGETCIPGHLDPEKNTLITEQIVQFNSIVRLKCYSCKVVNNRVVLSITDLDAVFRVPNRIGNPVPVEGPPRL